MDNYVTNISHCITSATELMNGNLNLIPYSHIPIAVVSLILGIFVLKSNYKLRSAKIFFLLSLLLSIWVTFNMIAWISSSSVQIMFFWSLFGIVDSLIFLLSFYLVYIFLNKNDLKYGYKVLLFILLLPIILFTPTVYNLTGFNYIGCYADDNLFLNYIFVVKAVLFLLLLIASVYRFNKTDNSSEKKQILLMSSGISFFLLSFLLFGYLADTLENYSLEIYGVFAMIFFMASIAYIIVKFKTFNVRLIGAQALVFTLIAFLGSRLFLNEDGIGRIITFVNLTIVSFAGYFLIKSVKKEISARERIEALADELEHTNERLRELDQQKTQFVSLASHQLRAPLTAIKGYLSMILEGDYGPVEGEVKDMVKRVETSANNLVTIVGDFLDVSRIEQGKMQYDWSDFDLKPLVEIVEHELVPTAEKKGLKLSLKIEEHVDYLIHGDMNKIKQVLTNLMDNSIKYTQKGEVVISLSRPLPKVVRFEIKDTGIGISKETIPKLFEKFVRAEGANDVNVIGTGLGLFVAKEMIKAHEGGKVWAESEGLGKGSKFVVELKAI